MQPTRQPIYPAAAALLFGILAGGAAAPAATTDAFLRAGHLIEARDTAQATLLRDGTVLVTGGEQSGDRALSSAELFDPGTSQFTAVGPMTTPRLLHGAVRLQDGRVLIAGGFDGSSAAGAAGGEDGAVGGGAAPFSHCNEPPHSNEALGLRNPRSRVRPCPIGDGGFGVRRPGFQS